MSAVPDEFAARRIQELETTLKAAEWRNQELARHVDLLTAENERLRDSESELRQEAMTLRSTIAELHKGDDS